MFKIDFLGFLSHPQNVYPSYLTPPLALNHNINMSQLNMVAHHQHQMQQRISPQHLQQPPSHMQSQQPPPTQIPVSLNSSVQPQIASPQSPHLSIRTPSPDKKSTDVIVDGDDCVNLDKESAAINMTISPQSVTTDIRTNSIVALRIKAKEHLENINKNMTMV